MHSDVQRSHPGNPCLSLPSFMKPPVPWQAEVKESTEAKVHGRLGIPEKMMMIFRKGIRDPKMAETFRLRI